MKYIETDWRIPYFNMAFEQYALESEKFSDGCFFFYVHEPSVIIGSHQNTYSEINYDYVVKNNITVARRLSGGGAVYHDEGNLNYSFILPRGENDFIDFKKYTSPVICALKKLGCDCSLSGRNDLLYNGRKFSGNAQYRSSTRILHHGTVMYDVDITKMVEALNADSEKFIGKAVDSVKSRVINLKEALPDSVTLDSLKEAFIDEFTLGASAARYKLTDEDIFEVNKLVKEKFSLDDYNFGSKIPFSTVKKKKFPAGLIKAEFDVKNNVITKLKITGDYFTNGDITKAENALCGCRYEKEAIEKTLSGLNGGAGFDNIIAGFTADEMIQLMFL